MKRVWRNAKAHAPKPATMLASLLHSPEEVEKMDLRLKVSREEKNLALFLVRYRRELQKSPDEPDSLRPYTDFIIDVSEKLFVSLTKHLSAFKKISPEHLQLCKFQIVMQTL